MIERDLGVERSSVIITGVEEKEAGGSSKIYFNEEDKQLHRLARQTKRTGHPPIFTRSNQKGQILRMHHISRDPSPQSMRPGRQKEKKNRTESAAGARHAFY